MSQQGISQMSQYSIINSMRTGNIFIDMFMATMIPMLIPTIYKNLQLLFQFLGTMSRSKIITKYYYRKITYARDPHCSNDNPNFNNCFLIIPILQYIGSLDNNYEYGTIFNFIPVWDKTRNTFQSTKSSMNIFTNPAYNIWTYVSDNIEIYIEPTKQHNTTTDPSGRYSQTSCFEMSIELRSKKYDDISIFINKAVDWYNKQVQVDNKKYYYVPNSIITGQQDFIYTKYELGTDTTFDGIFFRDKQKFMQLVNNFKNKTGKFNIKGVKHRMGIFLHGPPGTGKTSIIKSLANDLSRDIVTIPLSKIKTNGDLMRIMFSLNFKCSCDMNVQTYSNEPKTSVSKKFSDIIFVIEDIDAITNIVRNRSTDSDNDSDLTKININEQVRHANDLQSNIMNTMTAMSSYNAVMNGANMLYGNGGFLPNTTELANDELSLAGILNCIDGVIDTPGRIIIMTTNHPELLDPALIRPGRMDFHLHMTYITPEDTVLMAKNFYGDITDDKVSKIISMSTSTNKKKTPAEIEQLAMSCEIDEFIANLH